MGPECKVCGRVWKTNRNIHNLIQIQHDTFVCKPCIVVWYNDWLRMRNPWPHLPMCQSDWGAFFEGEENDACDDEPSSL